MKTKNSIQLGKGSFFFFQLLFLIFYSYGNLKAQQCFNAPLSNAVDRKPFSITTADFNNDGKPDLASANSAADNISVLIGIGNGNFANAINIPLSSFSNPGGIVSADFNGDTNIDFAVGFSSDSIAVCLGDGTGNFSASVTSKIDSGGVTPLVAADFNLDGKIDLAIVYGNYDKISIALGLGNGHFNQGSTYIVGYHPMDILTNDFDGDGKMDLAVTDTNRLSVLLGMGNGNFSGPVQYPLSSTAGNLACGDFNKDGKKDLVVSLGAANFAFFSGFGNGAFNLQSNLPYPPASPMSMVPGDFDGDGNLDLATADFNNNTVSILSGLGNGNFTAAATFPAGTNPNSIVAGDFSTDGKIDLAVAYAPTNPFATSYVSVLLNCSAAGIDKHNNSERETTVYPNPATRQVTIEVNKIEKQIVQIFDMSGKLMLTKSISGSSNIDVSNLNEGIYTLSVKTGNNTVNKKLVIQK